MTPTQHALHEAHKARLARMSGAPAPRPVAYVPPVLIAPKLVPAPTPQRQLRQYETKHSPPTYMPLSRRIIKTVADEFGLSYSDLTGVRRIKPLTTARFVAVGLLFEMTQLSYPAMGRVMGGRDHTTMLHARKQAEKLFASEAFRNRVDQIKQAVAQ